MPRGRSRWVPAALGAAVSLLASRHAAAADAEFNAPDWAFGHPGAELMTAGVCLASLSTTLIPQRRGTWGAFYEWEHDAFYGRISDITGAVLGSALAMTSGYLLESRYYELGASPHPYARSLRTTLIDLEAMAFATGVSYGIKRLTGRCRPRAWKKGKCSDIDTDYDAFPSGHTTPVAAIAGVRFALAINTTGRREMRYTAFGIAEGLAVATAFLRVAAGAHSWEDVLGGWILGHGTGMLLAYAHPMVDLDEERPSETSQPLRDGLRARTPFSRLDQPVIFSWGGTF
jgi:membrane-associated phospholipid phosphatase